MNPCRIPEIDKVNKALIKEAKNVIIKKKNPEDILKKISDFRLKLAYNKSTESLESNFGWVSFYENLIDELSKNIKT
jgi:hypothetical protein